MMTQRCPSLEETPRKEGWFARDLSAGYSAKESGPNGRSSWIGFVGVFQAEDFRRGETTRAIFLFPEAQVTKDVLNHAFLLDQGDQLHFAATFRTKERVGIPDFFDKFAPGAGRNSVMCDG